MGKLNHNRESMPVNVSVSSYVGMGLNLAVDASIRAKYTKPDVTWATDTGL